ncbi:flagellar filament capping protein FliD [Candidatus Magnetaquicoccus inordinatus]|uniref:flagellar filament capping protein FliD n=1 Tax=Candidatus Magnetaquicoccus inordinatus TaxID=2496818 RepID=UPI00187D22D8|nr:flagellar filament capping protein FliD [Candidatus Magnetaquicoccus inordinatus]
MATSSGTISFGGLASGLPSDMVDQLMKAQQGQLTGYQTAKARLAEQKTTLASFKSKITDLTSKIATLQYSSSWAPHTVSSSDTNKLTATAGSAAISGSHSLHVARLATNDTWVLGDASLGSSSGVASTSDSLTAGSNFTFTYNGVTYGTDANTSGFSSSDLEGKTLTEIASLINNITYRAADGTAQDGVSASVMYDGSAYRLVMTARDSGMYGSGAAATSRITMGASSSLSFASSGTLTSFNNTVAAQNALFKLDGVDVTSTTNSPTTALTGVTLQLLATTGATVNGSGGVDTTGSTAISLSIANDTTTVKNNLNAFVESYNTVVKYVNDNREGSLAGVSLARTVVTQIRNALNTRTHKAGASSATDYLTRSALAEFGLRTDSKTGLISFDSTSLDSALQNDYSGLASLFSNTQAQVGTGYNAGLAYRLKNILDGMTNSVTGSFTAQTNGLQSRMNRLDKDISRENSRLEKVRQQLTLKYSNLEQLVSQLNSAGSAMTSALSKLS